MPIEYEVLDTDEDVTVTSIGSHKYSSYIIMGKDKLNITYPSGNTKVPRQSTVDTYEAGSIDMFVGLNKLNLSGSISDSSETRDSFWSDTKYVNSDFSKDAARIYISEKSDPDSYFGLRASLKSQHNYELSSVCLLADAVRIIGRNSIKLVTKQRGEYNSSGHSSFAAGGIHLIAGNNPDDLQGIPKGENLVEYLKLHQTYYYEVVDLLREILETELPLIWKEITTHIHTSAAPGSPTSTKISPNPANPKFNSMGVGMAMKGLKLINQAEQGGKMTKQYLTSGSKKYILSEKNLVN